MRRMIIELAAPTKELEQIGKSLSSQAYFWTASMSLVESLDGTDPVPMYFGPSSQTPSFLHFQRIAWIVEIPRSSGLNLPPELEPGMCDPPAPPAGFVKPAGIYSPCCNWTSILESNNIKINY